MLDGFSSPDAGFRSTGEMAGVTIRHSTLVPAGGCRCACGPETAGRAEPGDRRIRPLHHIEHSIVGAIRVNRDEFKQDPGLFRISDSVLDATGAEGIALGAPQGLPYAVLNLGATTVFGQIQSHTIVLAENSIFHGLADAASNRSSVRADDAGRRAGWRSVRSDRRQAGCVRFSYLPAGARTPRRYRCQPATDADVPRVRPTFTSLHYGEAGYGQLNRSAVAPEIWQGADDGTELGAFHDLSQPQRETNLCVRLAEYAPFGLDVGFVFVT